MTKSGFQRADYTPLHAQIDQRSGAWRCFFCGQAGGDAGSLSLLDAQVRMRAFLQILV